MNGGTDGLVHASWTQLATARRASHRNTSAAQPSIFTARALHLMHRQHKVVSSFVAVALELISW